MCQELGYEDQPEFEDALQGSFSNFLNCLPHAIKKTENGRCETLRMSALLQPCQPDCCWPPVVVSSHWSSAADGGRGRQRGGLFGQDDGGGRCLLSSAARVTPLWDSLTACQLPLYVLLVLVLVLVLGGAGAWGCWCWCH
jgi:hypothetical protein